MGKRTILVDDLDGRELPDDTKPLVVSVDGKKHELFLSAKNTERFMDFLNGDGPLTTAPAAARKTAAAKSNAKEVREWAKQNGFPDLPDRGRIPAEVMDAYNAR